VISAIVLINAEVDRIPEVAQAIAELDGVSEVYSVAGPWDLVAILRAKDNEQLADIVTTRMVALEGVQETQTLVAFRAFSRFDLDVMFNVGLD
jgi:DNA-binding Lrp family transcriptional regulator